MEYEDMLEKARNSLPEAVFTAERFEIPKVVGHVEGNKTVISNFPQIVGVLRRELQHVLKFILKELATPGEMRRNDLILGRKLSASMINEKIVKYARTFVLCVECGKPDTQIIKEEEITYLKCQACGAKHPVKSKI
jgi:translation initiation factor 2 subunit 2